MRRPSRTATLRHLALTTLVSSQNPIHQIIRVQILPDHPVRAFLRRLSLPSIIASLATVALAFGAIATDARAQSPSPNQQYERRELTIPVRDGTKLFAIALIPAGSRDPLPIILTRTPFGAERALRCAMASAAAVVGGGRR